MEPGSVAYNIPAEVRLQGKLKVEALRQSLEQIVQRHEVLRTRFEIIGEQPCQIIAENVPIELPPLDLTSLAAEAREKTLDDLRAQEASTPFDLRRGPVFRAKLIKCGEEDFVLLFTMHHIASDGWSLSVLMQDLKTFYAKYANGEVPATAELPIQYADYSVWLRQWLQGDVLERQLDYWRKHLTAPPLELPTDFPRAAVQSLEGGRYRFQVGPGLTKKLKDLGQRKGATLFIVLLGSFQVLLSRYTGQREIKVGTPIANRNRQELEGLIGFFVNTLVLQTRIEPTNSFLAVLDQVREVTLGAYAHQDVPFEKLVEELEPERDLSRSPLFQVMLALQNMPRTAAEMPDLQLSMANIDTSTSKFDLSLFVSEEPDGLDIWVEYSSQLFRRGTIVRLCQSWEEILLSVAVDPDKRVWELPVLTPWKQLLLAQWNTNSRQYPSYSCVHELVERRASLTPETVAVAYENQTITYSELNSRANKVAHYLRNQGVGADSIVGICMERSLDMIVGVLGILKAGGAYVPLDPAYPEDRLRFMTRDAGARIILTKKELLGVIPAKEVETVCIDHDWSRIKLSSSSNPLLITCPDNLAYVIYTSGSTGQPKGVMMGHGALCNLLQWQQYHGVNRGKTLQFASLSFDVSFQEIFSTLIAGDTLILVSDERRRDPEFLQSLIMKHGVECLFMPFLALHTLAESATGQGVTLSSLKDVVSAGERLQITPAVAKFFAGLPRTALHNHYGPSETHVVTALTLQSDREQWSAYPTIGKPIDNTEIHILDEFMQQRPIGVAGEIYIGGVALARGYLNRPKLTAERFVPDHLGHPGSRLYRTGDLGRYLEDGTIEFLGRKDHQVKILGYRIELGEIESSLMQHQAVEKAAVDVLEDSAGQKQLVAYVVMRPGMESMSGTLEHALRQKLPDYMVPAQFVVIPDIPASSNGKTDRQKLKKLASLPKLKIEITPPRNSVEEMISEIWSGLLKRTEIGIHQNFFRVGGHSLLATRLASRIRTVWNVEMPVRTIFEAPTIAEQAEVIARLALNGTRENIPAIEKVARDQALPLSFPQQRLWFLEQLNPEANNYLIPSVLRLKGPLNSPALRTSLNKVIQRHEALRTTFTVSKGKPAQVVHACMEIPFQEASLESIPDEDRQSKVRELVEKESSAKFDFAHGPLLKACLIRLNAKEHLLVLVLHHIITDGWSMGILLKELVAFYESEVRGESRQLDALKIQYADYAAWQHRWLKGAELDRQLSYWTKKLTGAPGLLALPTDKPRPAIQNRAGAICHLEIDEELTSALHQLAWQNGSTLFMVLIAGFNVLLSRYSGQEDVVIGTPIAGRNHQELEELIGLFVNTLALRTNVMQEARFIDLVAQVKACTLEAYAHSGLPFERVVEELAIERTMAHTPVFQVLFALQNVPAASIAMEHMEITQEQVESRTAKFDVTLALRENKGRLVGDMEYRTDLFEPATISRLAKHFENLLRSAVANPEQHVQELQFLDPDERTLLLAGHNGTEKKWVSNTLPTEMIRERATQNPDSIALVFQNNIWTYRQLHEETNRLANNLKARGVGHGSIVGVCMERSAPQVLALLAVMKSGAAYVPLDPTYPAERLRYMIEHAAAKIVIVDESTQPLVGDSVLFTDFTRGSVEDVSDGPKGHDLAYVIYTSGSTGRPKGVMIRHANLKNLVEWQCATVGITAQDRGTYVAGLGFDAAALELWPYLTAGASVAIPEEEIRTDPERLQEWLTDLEATISFAPTPMAEYLLARDWPESSRLRALHTGGDRLTRRPRSSFKFKMINNYGPTETTVIATSTFVAPDGEMQPSIGLPIANTTVYVLDSRLQPVPRGVIGKLYAGGDGVALGYLRQPALTAERFVPDLYGKPGKRLYDTGDLVRQRSDGDLDFIARADHQVKLRGFRIELGEIESLLRNHATLLDAVVILWESGNNKRLVAFVVTQPGEQADQETLRQYLEARLPAYMVPSIFMFVDALPVTSNGKIDRSALPTPIMASAGRSELVAPRDSVEEELARIWKGLLQTDAISVTDNFFLVGGHSLLAIELMYKIEKEFNRKLPISTLFKSGTIEDLAVLIRSQDMASRSILVEISGGTGKQPFFCVHGAGGQVFRYKELANYLAKERPFIGLEANESQDSCQSIEEMAAQYLIAIREVQAEGPYYLGGWSFGGVVAFEIAQQLTRQGEEVALLTMFDTTAPGTENKLLSDQEIKEILTRDLSLHATSDRNDAMRSMLERAKADSVVPPSFELPDVQRFLSLFSQHMKAAQNYAPDPWMGKIILFEARERLPKQVADASLGWAMLSQSVDRYVIPGNHYSMLRAPNVKSLAEQLRQHWNALPWKLTVNQS
jgi:amino acid adenylation domain-containing protein